MSRSTPILLSAAVLLLSLPIDLCAQKPPYDVFPPADPPYYRVRYEAGAHTVAARDRASRD